MDDELARQFAMLGAIIAPGADQSAEPEGFEVLPDNWISVCAFLACETQWRVLVAADVGLIRLGLDYVAVDVVLRHWEPANPPPVLADLQIMEAAALDVFRRVAT